MLSTTIFASERRVLICRIASIPFNCGIEISVTITSGAKESTASRRANPSWTTPTRSNVSLSKASKPSVTIAWSSARRTFVFGIKCRPVRLWYRYGDQSVLEFLNTTRKVNSTLQDCPNSGAEFLACVELKYIAANSVSQRFRHQAWFVVHAEHQDNCIGRLLENPSTSLDSVNTGH